MFIHAETSAETKEGSSKIDTLLSTQLAVTTVDNKAIKPEWDG